MEYYVHTKYFRRNNDKWESSNGMQQRTNILLDVYIEWMEHLYKASALFLDNFIRMRTTFEEETNLMYEFKDISSFRLFSAIFGWQIGFKLELLTGSFNQSVWFFFASTFVFPLGHYLWYNPEIEFVMFCFKYKCRQYAHTFKNDLLIKMPYTIPTIGSDMIHATNHQSECPCFFTVRQWNVYVPFVVYTSPLLAMSLYNWKYKKILSHFAHLYSVYPFQIVLCLLNLYRAFTENILLVFWWNCSQNLLADRKLSPPLIRSHWVSILCHLNLTQYSTNHVISVELCFGPFWTTDSLSLSQTNYLNNIHFTKSVYKLYPNARTHTSARLYYSQNVRSALNIICLRTVVYIHTSTFSF